MARKAGAQASAAHEEAGGAGSIVPRVVAVISLVAAIGSLAYGLSGGGPLILVTQPQAGPQPVLSSASAPGSGATPEPAGEATTAVGPSPAPSTATPNVEPSPASPRIGIVVGHWGSDTGEPEADTGAVCPEDGLTEVEVNLSAAELVVAALRELGYEADIFHEFDDRLRGYRATALVSIHADSCESFPDADPPASGFKVARAMDSSVPLEEDLLVACLAQAYAARTGLRYHANSVTTDMTSYHTFYEIDQNTPAAIIEIGFLRNDRDILTQQPELVAQGIVDGILCFLQGQRPQ